MTKQTVKKRVTFSDDTTTTFSRSHSKRKNLVMSDQPLVFVRKTWKTIPWHLLLLVVYYLKFSQNYNTFGLLTILIPTQILYLYYQFNSCVIYGKKRLKINNSLLLITILASLILSGPTMVIAILFGASFVENLYSTWLLSLHATSLAYPIIYSVINCNFKVGLWKKYFVAIIIGGWLSCVVIPLDWDRDWQQWPIPIVVGVYLGAFVGYSIGAYV